MASPREVPMWTREEAIELATLVESVAPAAGAHIGLTGGLLYKDGPRKDLDIVVYRIRQVKKIDRARFFIELRALDIRLSTDHGFVAKATYRGRAVDFLFPESAGSYQVEKAEADRVEAVARAVEAERQRDEARAALAEIEGATEAWQLHGKYGMTIDHLETGAEKAAFGALPEGWSWSRVLILRGGAALNAETGETGK